jgi:hypothetical protein
MQRIGKASACMVYDDGHLKITKNALAALSVVAPLA